MKKILILLVSLVLPGIGQIITGRILVGVLFFLATVVLVDYTAVSVLQTDTASYGALFYTLIGIIGAIWLACQTHLIYVLYVVDPKKNAERKELVFREGLRYYVRDELKDAIRQFDSVLKIDRFDYDAWFYLGNCHIGLGNAKRAIKCFKKCIEFDDDRKWAAEVATELQKAKLMKSARSSSTAKAG